MSCSLYVIHSTHAMYLLLLVCRYVYNLHCDRAENDSRTPLCIDMEAFLLAWEFPIKSGR